MLHGQRSGVRLRITLGIKQGCPAWGCIWALAYDPIIRCVLSLRPRGPPASARHTGTGQRKDAAAPVHKFVAMARHVKSLGLGWADRVLAYRMLAQSVLRFVGDA